MVDFASFVLTDEIKIPYTNVETVSKMRLQFQKWRTAYNKEGRERFWIRQEEDFDMLVTPAQVQTYMQSKHSLQANAILERLQSDFDSNKLTVEENLTVRDHLMARILFSNGHRSGVVSNMKVSEFRKFKIVDSMYQIKVAEHKNFAYCGHAIVSVTKDIFDMLFAYVDKVRFQTNPRCDNVFLSHTGNLLKSGDVSKRINILWVNAGIFDGKDMVKNLSSNIIRKSTTSGTRAANTGGYQEIADLMAHAKSTADKHYHIRKQSESAAMHLRLCHNIFYSQPLQESYLRAAQISSILVRQDVYELILK